MTNGSVCLILNGKAAMRDDVREAVRAIRDEGIALEVRVTWEGGDAERFARQAAGEGFRVVVAGGGDGTINQVVTGLMEGTDANHASASLAVMPLGTANDLARACLIPLDPRSALRLAVFGSSANVDVGRVNGRYLLNVATGGFGSQVTVATPPELKKLLGGAAYLLTGMTHFTGIRPEHGRLTGAGFAWEGPFLVLAVGNGRQAGGGHVLCPEALINDGCFDVRVLPRLPSDELSGALRRLLREGREAIHRSLVSARLPHLEIETTETLQINLDGEPIMGTRFVFELLPGRVAMKLPPECPVLVPVLSQSERGKADSGSG
jgi:lipid kinase YegS